MTPANARTWRSRAMIIGIALISFGPFALAWYYARHPELIENRSNYGQLLIPSPHLEIADIRVRSVGGGVDPDIRGHWVLLHLAAGPCGDSCDAVVRKTHQVRLMLNKEIQRVRRVLLTAGEPSPQGHGLAPAGDEDLLAAAAPAGLTAALTTALGHPPPPDAIVLMDPLGNLVLWYPADFDPYLMLKDLKHLLKASQIG